jgi:DNA polymerase elongation subunit (family B)
MRGVLLDCQPAGSRIRLWLKTEAGMFEGFCDFQPRIILSCDSLDEAARTLSGLGMASEEIPVRDLILDRYVQALSVAAPDCEGLPSFVRRLEEAGNYRWRLFNADLGAEQMFIYERGLRPLSWVQYEAQGSQISKIEATDSCEDPGLVVALIRVEGAKDPRLGMDCKIVRVDFDGCPFAGGEQDILLQLKSAYESKDPDVVLVADGDSYATEYLMRRFEDNGIAFQLGRRGQKFRTRQGKSYFSYGHILRRNPSHYLIGRIHIDSSGFMYREAGLDGISELARLTYLPMQKVARLSPGAAISNLYVATAYQMGYPIPYKWNMVEDFKSAKQLLDADRGGFIYEPKVGFHTDVAEMDFMSLYPHIMVRYNISPETVMCGCCDGQDKVPYAGYHICSKRRGLVPQVIEPLITLRIAHKRRYDETGDERYKRMADALKWVLVTSFGYTGYRRSRFARIEAHESITSYARHILQETASMSEDMGFEVLHGIVDSLWVQKEGLHETDLEVLKARVQQRFKIPLKCEGLYRWIVFLPSVSNVMAPVPNRYYGVFENGQIKVRGIELRRGDSPKIVKDLQTDVMAHMSAARTQADFMAMIPQTMDILRSYLVRLKAGDVPHADLAVCRRISRSKYLGNNPQKVVVESLARSGLNVHPGESVRYVIRDSKSQNPAHRYVPLGQPLDGRIDVEKYTELMAKSLESLFLPFGYTCERILSGLGKGVQTTLAC